MRAVAVKNNLGMSPSKTFVAFPTFDDAHFLGVAADSAVRGGHSVMTDNSVFVLWSILNSVLQK
jgi:hypothetical protein